MNDDDAPILDLMCERVQAIRNIAYDLEQVTSKKGRDLLMAAAECLLITITPEKAKVIPFPVDNTKPDERKEKPL